MAQLKPKHEHHQQLYYNKTSAIDLHGTGKLYIQPIYLLMPLKGRAI